MTGAAGEVPASGAIATQGAPAPEAESGCGPVAAVPAKYGAGHIEARVFHASGERPEHVEAVLVATLTFNEVAADAETHTVWPSTGWLATVKITGPAPSALRISRRRRCDISAMLSDC